MALHQATIEVDKPVSAVYNQWTQFEDFPQFMEGVEQVRQLDDTHMHWVADVAGSRREWDAVITEQRPDQRIAWQSTSGTRNGGTVEFRPVGEERTEITLQLEVEPEGIMEKVGDKLFVQRRVEGDLERFRSFLQSRGGESGAWRGQVHGGQVEGGQVDGGQALSDENPPRTH